MTTNKALQFGGQFAVQTMKAMASDMSQEQFHWLPPGTAHSVAATYAHAALSTDWQIHAVFGQEEPFYAGTWSGKTGVNLPSPQQTAEWARTVQVEMPAFQHYADAVFAALDDYLQGLTAEQLASPVDLSRMGMGQQSLLWCLATLVIGHLNQLTGEISAIKGAQGLQGYPY